MSIHVTHIGRSDLGIAHRVHHHAETAISIFRRSRDVICVRAHAVTNDLGKDLRSTRLGLFLLFENNDSGAFAYDEAIAILIPRPAGLFRIIVARR